MSLTASSSTCSYPPEPADWARYRDVITNLYLGENKTLKEVRTIMESKYSFKATERMYTTRISLWGVHKNCKAKQKDLLAVVIANALANGQDTSHMTFRGRAIRYDKILRHLKAKRGDTRPVPCPRLAKAEISPREMILQLTSAYLDALISGSCLLVAPSPSSWHESGHAPAATQVIVSPDVDRFWHDLKTALYLLNIGSYSTGWNAFHKVWQRAAEIVVSHPHALLQHLFTTLDWTHLRRFCELRQLILQFLAELLELKFGHAHPLARICQQLIADEHTVNASEPVLRMIRDSLVARLGPHDEAAFQSHVALITCQRRSRDSSALDSARSLVRTSEFSSNSKHLARARRSLAHILKHQMQYEEAKAVYHEIISGNPSAMSKELEIYAREELAELHRLGGHLGRESICLKQALVASERHFGIMEATTLHLRDKLEVSLQKRHVWLGPLEPETSWG